LKRTILSILLGLATCTPAPAAESPETGNYSTHTIIKSFGACMQGLQSRFQRQGLMVPYDYMEKYCTCVLDDIRQMRTEEDYLQKLETDGEATIVPHVLSCNIKMIGEGPGVTSTTEG